MPHVMIASDAQWVHDEIRAALTSDVKVTKVVNGKYVRDAARDNRPDLLVVDSQIGGMGAFAIAYDLRNEETGGRLPNIPILALLDRGADVFLARNAGVAGFLVKPLDALRTRKAIKALLAGERFEDRVPAGDATNNFVPTPDATGF